MNTDDDDVLEEGSGSEAALNGEVLNQHLHDLVLVEQNLCEPAQGQSVLHQSLAAYEFLKGLTSRTKSL